MFRPGDILFYKNGNAAPFADQLIAWWTSSSIVHVAIAISGAQKIEALQHGVVLTPINEKGIATSWSYMDKASSDQLTVGLTDALAWLHSQLGQVYGWGDILDAILWKYEHAVSVDIGEHFDCSALATEFLLKAGGVKQLVSVTNPHVVTPQMLATLLGVTS